MLPFPGIENQAGKCEGPSPVSEDSCETPASYGLSAVPQPLASARRTTRFSLPSPVLHPQRFSFNGNLLNFSALEPSDAEVSPKLELKDKFDSQISHGPAASASEVNSPSHGQISIDNDHPRSTPRSGRKFFKPQLRADSDPYIPSSSFHSSMGVTDDDVNSNNRHYGSHSPSKSHSRAVSPLQFIHGLSTSLHHNRHRSENEELFVPINPFKSKIKFEIKTWFNAKSSTKHPVIELGQASVDNTSTSSNGAHDCDAVLVSSVKDCARHAHVFIVDVLPRYIYLNLLLRLPALYFSRVARVFRDAEISRPDIERMTEAGEYSILPLPFDPQLDDRTNSVFQQLRHPRHRTPEGRHQREPVKDRGVPVRLNATAGLGMGTQVGVAAATPPHVPQEVRSLQIVTPALRKFKHSWEMFIDSLLREWKTLNVVSALLASAILTIFQIPDAAGDPITRTAAILSLICSLMSLTYGCIYIVRFSTMRTMLRASKWAEEARRTKTAILWNVWVLLAMPAIWLAWSMILFMVTIISFVWRTGSEADPEDGHPPLTNIAALGPRIAVSMLAFIGFVYLILIIRTLKGYGMHGGTSRNLLTSPSAQLQQVFVPHATTLNGERESGMKHVPLSEAAFERRGRERMRSIEPRHGRRREEVSEHREERAVQDELVEGNELGLYTPV